MTVQTLIYAYFAICVSMILFNCVCIFVFSQQDKGIQRRNRNLGKLSVKEIDRLGRGEPVSEEHIDYLKKKLVRVGNLVAFDEMMDSMYTNYGDRVTRGLFEQYVEALTPVFTHLAVYLRRRSDIRQAHYAYMVSKYRVLERQKSETVMDFMRYLVSNSNIYCRENALMAIYSSGDAEAVLQALLEIDRKQHVHHSKLLTDGLLTFRGSHDELIQKFLNNLSKFRPEMQVSILNYVRFCSGDYCEAMMELLLDERQDYEVHLSCIRYFGRYYYGPAYPVLMDYLERPLARRWEYAAIAATALANYPSKETKEILKQSLYARNWYIRYNASDSLRRLKVSYEELADVLDGKDRFAREILMYRVDRERSMEEAQQKKKEAAV